MKNTKDPNQYYQQLQGMTLSEDRKRSMREELGAYADLSTDAEGVRVAASTRLPWYTQLQVAFMSVRQKRMVKAGILIAVLATTGGATSYAAQDSVPGDTLYPVKVHMNENVRGAFAVGANAETRHQAQLLAERVSETEALLDQGELTTEQAATLSARMSVHAEKLQEQSAQADATVQAEVQSGLDARLSALQSRLDAREDAASASITAGLEQIRSAMQSDGEVDAEVEASIEQPLDTIISTEARTERARESLERADDVSAEARAELDAKLDSAAETTAEARAEIEADASAVVQDSLNTADALIGEVEAELQGRGTTSIEAGSRSGGDTNSGSVNDASADADAEAGIRVESTTEVDTDEMEVNGTQDLEGEIDVRSSI